MHRFRYPHLLRLAAIFIAASCSAGMTGSVANATTNQPHLATTAAVPRCTSAGLDVWLDTEGSGSAGGSYYYLEFTNISGHRCTLAGYPGVSAITIDGRQLGSAASRDTVGPARVITLQSASSATGLPPLGGAVTATVVLKITDVGVYSPATCGYVTAAGLRVYPPNQTVAKIVPYPFIGCRHRGSNFLLVAPVERASLPD